MSIERNYVIIAGMDNSKLVSGVVGGVAALKGMDAILVALNATGAATSAQLNKLADDMKAIAALGGKVAGSNREVTMSFGGFNAGTLAMQAARAAAHDYARNLDDLKNSQSRLTEDTIKYRDALREIAGLKGEGGPNNKVLGESLKLSLATGLTPEESRKYEEQFEGSAPAGDEKGNIDAKTREALKIEGAKFGQRLKINPQTAGDLAGVMSQYGKVPNIEAGAAQLGQIAYGLNKGRGNVEPLTRSMINVAGAVVSEDHGSPIKNLPALAAMLGVASTQASPLVAATRIRQQHEQLFNPDTPEAKDYNESVGIKDGMEDMQALKMMKDDMDKKGVGKAGGPTLEGFLHDQGHHRAGGVRALAQGIRNYDLVMGRMGEAGKITGKSVMEADEAFRTKDISGVASQAEADAGVQNILDGEAAERDAVLKRNAAARLRVSGGVVNNDPKARTMSQYVYDQYNFSDTDTGRDRDIRFEALRGLEDQARKLKIPQAKIDEALERKDPFGLAAATGMDFLKYDPDEMSSPKDRARRVGRLSELVERAGGNVGGERAEIGPKIDKLISATEETNRILRQAPRPPLAVPPQPPGQPAVRPVRP